MLSGDLLGILMALTSALVWGGGDFSGGFASRRSSSLQVLALSALSGIAVLAVGAWLSGEHFPSPAGMAWAALAGVMGAVGLAALYQGLSLGQAANVAPTSAVIGAGLPVLFGILSEGLPGITRLAGFGLALAGIWLVSGAAARGGESSMRAFGLACLAGVGFGAFFILIAQADRSLVFTTLIVSRTMTFVAASVLLLRARQPMIAPAANPVAFLAGMLDAGGNIFFLLARQFTRLDAAVVLASLYPASTVFLSFFLLKEKIAPSQWLGVSLCLAAIVLITV